MLVGWSSYLVVPIFALANGGVDLRGVDVLASVTSPVALGVSVGLVAGKLLGISVASYVAVRLGLGKLPVGTSFLHIIGLSAIGGIGFTVSLFVAGLAFSDPVMADLAKVGILSGSLAAGVIGAVLLSQTRPRSL
jgi:NhaA family Na+:H+ antiporter